MIALVACAWVTSATIALPKAPVAPQIHTGSVIYGYGALSSLKRLDLATGKSSLLLTSKVVRQIKSGDKWPFVVQGAAGPRNGWLALCSLQSIAILRWSPTANAYDLDALVKCGTQSAEGPVAMSRSGTLLTYFQARKFTYADMSSTTSGSLMVRDLSAKRTTAIGKDITFWLLGTLTWSPDGKSVWLSAEIDKKWGVYSFDFPKGGMSLRGPGWPKATSIDGDSMFGVTNLANGVPEFAEFNGEGKQVGTLRTPRGTVDIPPAIWKNGDAIVIEEGGGAWTTSKGTIAMVNVRGGQLRRSFVTLPMLAGDSSLLKIFSVGEIK